jgi:glutathione S-transferase
LGDRALRPGRKADRHTITTLRHQAGKNAGPAGGRCEPNRFDLGDIAIATALAYIDFRKLQPGWADQHPKTAAWFAQVASRPSMVAGRLQDG